MIIDIFSKINPPKTNGIYFFKSHINEILYIGKAKNLYKRIFSYNTNKQIDWKIAYLLQKSTEIGWIETKTENDALILEAELISIHKDEILNATKVVTNGKITNQQLIAEIGSL